MMHSTKSSKKQAHSWRFEALGSAWSIDTSGKLADDIKHKINTRIEEFDKTYSRFRSDSLVQQLRVPGEYEFPNDIVPILDMYEKLNTLTSGRMTPLIGSMLEQAGYDATYSLKPKRLQRIPGFEALGWSGSTVLRPSTSVVLDIGAAGKGYLVDILADILEQNDVWDYTVDASGDVKHRGEIEKIGLEHPFDETKVIGVANVANKSLCASAVNRRSWQGLHHILDPSTKAPTKSLVASWTIADTTLLADALATALFFIPAATLREHFEFTWVTVGWNGVIDAAPDFDGELFI